MAFPATDLLTKVEAAPGADLTADPSTWVWVDISRWARGRVSTHRGREDTNGVVGPSTCTLRLADEDSRFTFFHPAGAYYPNWRSGTPIRVSLNPGTGWVKRFSGEVRTANLVFPSGNDDIAEVLVTAKGILHRLGQGQVLDSALRRALLRDDIQPVAYWTMEDGSDALTFGSATGGPPIGFADARPASDSTIAGSAPLPSMGPAAEFAGVVPAYPAASQWAVRWTTRLPTAPTVKTGILAWDTAGPVIKWVLTLTPQVGADLLRLEGYNAAGAEVLADPGVLFASSGVELYGQQLYVRADAIQSGANINWSYECAISLGSASTKSGTLTSAQVGNVARVYHTAVPGLTAGGHTIGHIAVAADHVYGTGSTAFAAAGWADERASSRVERLLREERLVPAGPPVLLPGTGGVRLGPQQRATALSLLRQAETAELGLLSEGVDGTPQWIERSQRYNRTVKLALDVNRGHVKLPFEPASDDQRLRNDLTVSRMNGATARYADVDVRDGAYPDSPSLNLATDRNLLNHAAWRVHAGTVDEMRITSLPINLQSSPDLIAAWLAMDIGDWLTVDNLPRQYPPGRAGLVLEGYTETFDAAGWSAVLNVSPSRPWEVFTVGHARLGRVDTAGSQLTAGVSAGATSLSVQTTSGPLWMTSAGRPQDFPPTKDFSVEVGGWQVPVSAITSPTPTFVGVGAAAAGNAASVTPALPGGIVAGDLLLCFAGCRNDASGVAALPAGWTTLVDFHAGTARLFGKIATGGDAAPTITYTGLAAGDTTLAQCAAFRGVTLTVASIDQLNASAQNIAYPGRGIPAASLVLYLGWKPSAWTSVAPAAGATEIGEPSSALGSGMGLVWDYLVSATPTAIQADSLVVTGGVAAASRGAVVVLAGSNIQTFTTGPVPGALAAGTPVRLWKPGALAL